MKRKHTILRQTSPLTGYDHAMILPIPPEEFALRMMQWRNGAMIQDAFRGLTADQREFIMTGITPEEFKHATKEEISHVHPLSFSAL